MEFEDSSKANGKTIVTLSSNIDYKAIDVIEDIKKKERLNLEYKLKCQQTKPKISKYGLCKVCKDTASGIHYGIAACDGCKGFFVRSLTKHKHYICYNNKTCGINSERRKSCKYCRFKLCLDLGMSLEAIKLGRKPSKKGKNDKAAVNSPSSSSLDSLSNDSSQEATPKGGFSLFDSSLIKESIDKVLIKKNQNIQLDQSDNKDITVLARIIKSNYSEPFNSSNIIPQTIYSEKYLNTREEDNLILLSLIRDKCYQLFNKYLKVDDKMVEQAKISAMEHKRNYTNFPGWDVSENIVWDNFLKSLSSFNKSLIQFSKELPGFQSITMNDMVASIKDRFFFVFGITIKDLYIEDERYHMISGIQLSRDWMYKFFSKEYVDNIFEFHRKFRALGLNSKEISLLIPVLLTSPLVNNLENSGYLNYLNKSYNRSLLYELSVNKRNDDYINQFIQHLEYFDRFQVQMSHIK